jgi:hypothetical protein
MRRPDAALVAIRPLGKHMQLISGIHLCGLYFPVLHRLDYAIDYRPPSAHHPIADGEWPPVYKLHWKPGVRDSEDGPIPFGMLPRDRLIFRRDRSAAR